MTTLNITNETDANQRELELTSIMNFISNFNTSNCQLKDLIIFQEKAIIISKALTVWYKIKVNNVHILKLEHQLVQLMMK